MAGDPQNQPGEAEEEQELANLPLLKFFFDVEQKVGGGMFGELDASVLVLLKTGAQPRLVVAGVGIDEPTQIRVLEWAIENLKQKIARESVLNPKIIIAR